VVLGAVFDGHGGAKASEFALQHFSANLCRHLPALLGEPGVSILESVHID
jgi:serine/threonine protein phosphatase PrpC